MTLHDLTLTTIEAHATEHADSYPPGPAAFREAIRAAFLAGALFVYRHYRESEADTEETSHPFSCQGVDIIECGCCGFYHRLAFNGDCRDDSERILDPDTGETAAGSFIGVLLAISPITREAIKTVTGEEPPK